MTKKGIQPWGNVSSRIQSWMYNPRYAGMAFILIVAISFIVSEASAVDELTTAVTKAQTLVSGPIAKLGLGGAVIGGGIGAAYAGQVVLGCCIIAVVVIVAIALSIVNGGLSW